MALVIIADGKDPNMRYATGLDLQDTVIWVGSERKQFLLVGTFEFEFAKARARRGTKVICTDRVRLERKLRNHGDLAAAWLLESGITEVKMPENSLASHVDAMRECGVRVRLQSPFFPERRIKSPAELRAIKRTGLVTKRAFKTALAILKEATVDWNDTLVWKERPLTSERLRYEIERVFLEHGCISGDTIVACAEMAAQPHNKGNGPLRAGEPIVIDLFPKDLSSGYYFDMTRTIIKGTPRKALRDMLQAVARAHRAGIGAVRAGALAADVDRACRALLDDAGYETANGEGFISSTGHGLGLAIHEAPIISARSADVLEAGMIITIEPGLYYKELGGVRIEDTIMVTERGCANLTNLPRIIIIP
jgi:Xaa-Pro aminopeptidase